MKNIALFCLVSLSGVACATPNSGHTLPMQPAPSAPAPLASTCACGGDKFAPDHATGCPCAGHQADKDHSTCGCGTGAEKSTAGASSSDE
jgi:hypothetical protein